MYNGRGSVNMHISFECGRSIMKKLLNKECVPDALYCQSDIIAMGLSEKFTCSTWRTRVWTYSLENQKNDSRKISKRRGNFKSSSC